MKELIRRIRENKYLTRNETDFIIKALEENSSLRKQVNMWQSEHAKRVLELGKLREGIKLTRDDFSGNEIMEVVETDDIKALPSVAPARKKGKWIRHGEHCENLGVIPSGLGAYEWCSNCDCGIDVREWHRNHYNYCPNCGSFMMEEEKE